MGTRTMRLARKIVKIAWDQFIPPSIREEASIYVGMQADMEIQRAAKLPARHFLSSGGTGARSSLYRLLDFAIALSLLFSPDSCGVMLMGDTPRRMELNSER